MSKSKAKKKKENKKKKMRADETLKLISINMVECL